MVKSLILFDGLPGSGKSTTAEWLTQLMVRRNLPCRLIPEREPDHPLNVGGELHPCGDVTGEAFYSQYSAAQVVAESLGRWRELAAQFADGDVTLLVDSYPFQSGVRLLMQLDVSPEHMIDYESAVEKVIGPMNPRLVFFSTPDPRAQLDSICRHRGAEWTEYAIRNILSCPYARNRALTGLEGAFYMVERYGGLIENLAASFPYPTLILTDCTGRWRECEGEIAHFLGLD